RAIGSVSISSNLFNVLAFFGGGLLIGLDTLVAQAFGAGRREDCHRSLVNSIYLSMVMTPFLMTAVWFFNPLLRRLHIDPQVAALAVPYMEALAFGLFPLLLYFAVRRCLQAMNMASPSLSLSSAPISSTPSSTGFSSTANGVPPRWVSWAPAGPPRFLACI